MLKPIAFVLVAGLSVALPVAEARQPQPTPASQPAGKIPVRSAADLPTHTYTIEGKASEFVQSDAPFKAFIQQVRTNLEGDLAKYDIQDKATLQQYYSQLMAVALLQGRDAEIPAMIEKIREVEGKESKKLMTGQTMLSYLAARKAGGDDAARLATFKKELMQRVAPLPIEKVREELASARGRAQMMSRDLILGQVKSGLDPVVEQSKGVLTGDLAGGLVSLRLALDHMLQLQPGIVEVYGAILDANKVERKDLWSPMQVTLTEAAAPVVVAIWDSGVDTAIFSDRLFTNTKETLNGKDDDGNGFVDDVHGIAFDLWNNPTPELLHPVTDLKNDRALVESYTKGLMDLQANVDSQDSQKLRQYLSGLKAEQVGDFLEDLGLYGNVMHGTHVAGITAAGNPFVRLLPVRVTFDYKQIPQITPSVEEAKKMARTYEQTVAYMKQHGVRVVNMSWGGGLKDVESSLEMKGVGSTPEERAKLAREIFDIGKNALRDAMASAPDILFVAAAGNSDNDNTFADLIPSGLVLPNMITIGAVDSALKPTGFTTFGQNVKLYANGFEVDSDIPGGRRMKASGTSMAAPQVANLAAKVLAKNPKLTTAQVIELITKNASPMPGYEGRYVVNPKKTLDATPKP